MTTSESDARELPLGGLRVGYFGRYDPRNTRNTIIARCLARAGAEVTAIRDDRSLMRRTPALLRRARQVRPDLLIVGFRAHSDVFLASAIARAWGVPLVFDPLTSRYEERVIDRQQVDARSWLAWWYRVSDRAGCRAADRLLLETDAQIDYFVETFGVSRAKCRRLWLGADDEVMQPRPGERDDERFTVFFYGRFSPLHGIEHIVEAASLLERSGEHIRFVIVGAGQTYQAVRTRASELGVSNITFREPVPYEALARHVAAADVCLGTFGTSARARRVIPYKVFDALAAGRPVITADTPAIREALTAGEDVWVCPGGDGGALADAVRTLKRDPALRGRLAANGHRTFTERFSVDALTRDLTAIIRELIGGGDARPVPR